MINYKRLIVSLVSPQLVGLVGSFFTATAISVWYAGLAKPALNPPGWVFGPVWILLYFLMGVSVYLIWQKEESTALFWIHLFFNALWSIIFFGLRSPAWALIDLLILWILVIVLIAKFWKISRPAAYLLIPYFLWVSFAGYLNYAIWRLI